MIFMLVKVKVQMIGTLSKDVKFVLRILLSLWGSGG